MSGLFYVFWHLLKLGLKAKWNGKAVNAIEVYELALDGMSRNLKKSNPADSSIQGIIEELKPHLPTAQKVIDRPATQKFDVENPIRAMRLFATSMETGVKRDFKIPANTLQKLAQISNDPSFSEEQKEQCLQLCCNAYLVGILAPVLQFDVFEHELDKLLLETRCKTREEISRELRKAEQEREQLKEDSEHTREGLKKVLETLQMLQLRDIDSSTSKIDVAVLERYIKRLHTEYNDVDNWATVPDCVDVMIDMLRDNTLPGVSPKKYSPNTFRVNIQKRLREAQVDSRHSANADFYRTIDIATEAVKECKQYATEQYLKEFNVIASPHDNLHRSRKKR